MAKQILDETIRPNRPLVEVSIALADGVDPEQVIHDLNELAEDFEVSPSVYAAIGGNKKYLTADATPEALNRLFGWEIKRVNLERWNPVTQRYEGVWEDAYRWEAMNKPTRYPACLEGNVIEIGLSQPGTNDDGQPC